MLRIVTDACEFLSDTSRGTVVVESDIEAGVNGFQEAFLELEAPGTRQFALNHAVRIGMADARVNGYITSPFAVNSEGVALDSVKDDKGKPLPQQHPRMQPHRFRVEVPVTRRLI